MNFIMKPKQLISKVWVDGIVFNKRESESVILGGGD